MTTAVETKKCVAEYWTKDRWPRRRSCTKSAKVERDGKWYCGVHDPLAVAKRNEERNAKYLKESAERNARWKRERDAVAAWDSVELLKKRIAELEVNQ